MRETGMAMVGTGKAEGEGRAREAAEAAINSPLLEDVNLKGARGILVNITAGEDMTIAEFEEVGTIVRGFAADDAVTIIGTCTDPAMPESIRVTIVATGLGERKTADTGTGYRPELVMKDGGLVPPDYAELDRPTVMRQGAQTSETESTDIGQKTKDEVTQIQAEYLDIPAFLRRQAD
jgi:cell division protein FtsZ